MSQTINKYDIQQLAEGAAIFRFSHKGFEVLCMLKYNEFFPEYYDANVVVRLDHYRKGKPTPWGLVQTVKAKDFDDEIESWLWFMAEATINIYKNVYKI